MKKFQEKLEKLLKKDLRFVDEDTGKLIRSEIVTHALKIDKKLIELLLINAEIKKKFFIEIKGNLVFNINDFIDYIQDKNFLSNSYTKFKNKIGLNIDNKFLKERGEVSLVWPFKDCILEGRMTKEDQKRNEIFFNETLAKDEIDRLEDPKVLTNFKKFTTRGEEKIKDFNRDEKGTIKDNLIIKGNNLLALHSLKKEFAGRVKLIYIDPPYNTGGSAETFTYNNSFNHSTWLTFMKNRLEVAKDFLRDDGFIAIAIDHVELFYLGALADEIFGRKNRLGIVSIVHQARGRWMDKNFSASNEFMLVYSKKEGTNIRNVVIDDEKKKKFNLKDDKGNYYLKEYIVVQGGGGGVTRKDKPNFWYPIYVKKDLKDVSLEKKSNYEEVLPITNSGKELTWVTTADTFMERYGDGEIVVKRENGKIVIYRKFREQQIIPTHWISPKYNYTSYGTLLLEKIVGHRRFSYAKSLYAVLDTLKLMTSENDIIMDFFAGSGTTGHATLELNKEDGGNRRFILIEQLDTHLKVIKERIQKVIQNNSKEKNLNNFNKNESFTYCELLKYNEDAIDKIQDAKNTKQLLEIWGEMCEHYFLNYDVEIKKFNDHKKGFNELTLNEQKKLLCGMLNKNQLYVNISEIEDSQFKVSKEDKELNKKFYN